MCPGSGYYTKAPRCTDTGIPRTLVCHGSGYSRVLGIARSQSHPGCWTFRCLRSQYESPGNCRVHLCFLYTVFGPTGNRRVWGYRRAAKRPTGWNGFLSGRGRLDPKNRRLRSAQNNVSNYPSATLTRLPPPPLPPPPGEPRGGNWGTRGLGPDCPAV